MMRAASEPEQDWYSSEQPTRLGLISELQRIKRRTWNRPIPVLVLAALITGGIVRKVANKPVVLEASVTLALTEGALSTTRKGIPFMQLREYVSSVLLPDNKLAELVEKFNLSRLRKKLGMQFAIDELRSTFNIEIWKNSFVYYDEEDEHSRRSARIGITVADTDPDRALDIAQELGRIVIETAALQRQKLGDAISSQVAMLREATATKLDKLELDILLKQEAIDDTIKRNRFDVAGMLRIDLAALREQQRDTEKQMSKIASSPDAVASEVAAAGLDMSITIVDERRPERPTHSSFVLLMIGVVVGTGVLVAVALVLGAFDSRVHESDDVTRLGLPVLGHVPGFAGDNVGSMRTRSVARARVPSFRRWRSHR
jgi:hypothetical protein